VPTGVYLHWTLPAALTHGKATTDGTTEFPSLPNRWLVLRSTSNVPIDERTGEHGVDRRERLQRRRRRGLVGRRHLDPTNLKFTRIGRSVDLQTWKESGGAATLKATGIADVTFTAYQPGVTNVFGLYDPMTGVAENANVTYLVAGWYGRPGDDPLAAQTPSTLELDRARCDDQQACAGGQRVPRPRRRPDVADEKPIPPRRDPDGTSLQSASRTTSIDAPGRDRRGPRASAGPEPATSAS